MKDTFFVAFWLISTSLCAKDIFVSPIGKDSGDGSQSSPFATFERAVLEVPRFSGKESVHVWFSEGTSRCFCYAQ